MLNLATSTLAAIAGLLGGIVLGVIARWGRFCSLGAIEDTIFGGDSRRLRGWGIAIAVAICGTYTLHHFSLVNINSSVYLSASATIPATLVGSLLFGFGMALVGTCGYGTLARLGGGDLKSAVTFLVMGITAYATMSGLTAYLRLQLFPPAASSDTHSTIAQLIASLLSTDTHHTASDAAGNTASALSGNSTLLLVIALLLASALLLVCLFGSRSRLEHKTLISAVAAGLCITWGWFATGRLATDPFSPQPLESYTFSAPLGESIVYIMTMTGATLNFGMGATAGVVLGALITSLLMGQFRWEACDDARELRRQMLGGMLMGFGSVTALGCTVGQGLSAASTLSITAPIAISGFFIGAWMGLRFLVTGNILWTNPDYQGNDE